MADAARGMESTGGVATRSGLAAGAGRLAVVGAVLDVSRADEKAERRVR
jgi:hypothetical protein